MALPQVGVEAVVQGLGSFINDVGKMNSAIGSLNPSGNIITRTLQGVSGAFKNLGASIVRVAEVALGVLVRDAFRAIIAGLGDIVRSTIEAGAAFQTMELRLNILNLNTDKLTGSQANYNAVMKEATELTRVQLSWLQKLAVQTPYDAEDIANVFTLARSYGFAATQAQSLTQDITDFAAGMGLGNTEIQRIIVNFGQMVQQGKVTQRELNDLARGAFVPVNDVLAKMRENVDMTDKEFEQFRYTGEGVNAFMQAFSDIVEQRFSGSAAAMARTFQGATDNAKDFIQSLVGFGIVKPILNQVGAGIADLLDALTTEERWNELTAAAGRVGEALADVFGGLQGFLPDAESLADSLVSGLNNAADWINANKDNILNFFVGIREGIADVVAFIRSRLIPGFMDFGEGIKNIILNNIVPFIQNTLIPAFQMISDWVEKYRGNIQQFFRALGDIVKTVISNLTGLDFEGGGLQGFLDLIVTFMDYVSENKDKIAEWVTWLIKAWGVLQLVGFVLSLIIGPIVALIGIILGVVAAFAGLVSILSLIFNPVTLVIAAIGLLVAMFIEAMNFGKMLGEGLAQIFLNLVAKAIEFKDGVISAVTAMLPIVLSVFSDMGSGVLAALVDMLGYVRTKVAGMINIFIKQPWGKIGRQIIEGIAGGVRKAADMLIQAAVDAAVSAINAVKEALGVSSPSKVFMYFGEMMMEGMAVGIDKLSGMVAHSMENAVGAVKMPAMVATAQMAGSVNTSNSYTNNYNLTVNSSSPTEPIVQDYNMLRSLAGA